MLESSNNLRSAQPTNQAVFCQHGWAGIVAAALCCCSASSTRLTGWEWHFLPFCPSDKKKREMFSISGFQRELLQWRSGRELNFSVRRNCGVEISAGFPPLWLLSAPQKSSAFSNNEVNTSADRNPLLTAGGLQQTPVSTPSVTSFCPALPFILTPDQSCVIRQLPFPYGGVFFAVCVDAVRVEKSRTGFSHVLQPGFRRRSPPLG